MECKICSGEAKTIYDCQFDINYYCCPSCDFIFIDELKIISPEKEKESYSLHNNTPDNEGYVNMFRDFIEKSVAPYQKRIKTALDFGCGPGPVLAALLKEKGFQVDIYDKYFAPEKVYQNKKYDLITATEVMEHLKDPLKTLKLLKEHLNTNGILAIMTLFHPQDEEKFKDWWYRRDLTHISFYTPKTFEFIAKQLGMKVLMSDEKRECVLG
ncbi:MAG: class I SAM-dependent methyltransferase [Candidatus Margulisbacteria bacterium]|nr:class I SAM-dependent methyltransferase [Candidatus Margulisiibacteriota bacterium]MBU1022195.1 class I SAM-dependent methyltransferase [Candidatus Margulisiibacteriota bacterium]MBU1729366.1 class I SAM-dependent methyltransferase [Candidatus Margulisiibacteriota bacterium]MBU1955639.1 class I SAM-dependent methyltransferase [Candidatus Margulisiibacteriota bacterium]